jgi:hypothetical protein
MPEEREKRQFDETKKRSCYEAEQTKDTESIYPGAASQADDLALTHPRSVQMHE